MAGSVGRPDPQAVWRPLHRRSLDQHRAADDDGSDQRRWPDAAQSHPAEQLSPFRCRLRGNPSSARRDRRGRRPAPGTGRRSECRCHSEAWAAIVDVGITAIDGRTARFSDRDHSKQHLPRSQRPEFRCDCHLLAPARHRPRHGRYCRHRRHAQRDAFPVCGVFTNLRVDHERPCGRPVLPGGRRHGHRRHHVVHELDRLHRRLLLRRHRAACGVHAPSCIPSSDQRRPIVGRTARAVDDLLSRQQSVHRHPAGNREFWSTASASRTTKPMPFCRSESSPASTARSSSSSC